LLRSNSPACRVEQQRVISSPKVAEVSERSLRSESEFVSGIASSQEHRPHAGRLLMVAFHFPPVAGSSGVLRSLKFCRYLPDFGWQPTVLTVHPRAYEQTNDSQNGEVPPEVRIVRSFALDTRKHLSFRGAYPGALALPDRWVSWLLGAVPDGLALLRKQQIDAIFTTFPIPSAVLIGYILHRMTGKPWIVDLRDSMTEDNYPPDKATWKAYRWIEKKVVRHAAKILFTAPGSVRMYRERYPELEESRCVLLPNGYDEPDFIGISRSSVLGKRLRLLHSGLVYPWERDPRPFFRALARLKSENKVSAETLSVELRACGSEEQFQREVADLHIADLVHFLPALPYRQALQDAADADALLLLQAACCDHQIPAKAYEYLRLGRPILGLTTHSGDTGTLLLQSGGSTVVDIADEEAIYRALPEFLQRVRTGVHPTTSEEVARQFSRRSQAERLASCLQSICAARE
jgi:glycosyltransferase involved in cell wall biosynthesis